MKSKLLWTPSEEMKKAANMTRFIEFVNNKHGKNFGTYDELYDWSIENIPDFWATFWEFVPVKASRKYDEVVDDLKKFPGTKWFVGAKLNFAENLLRYRDDNVRRCRHHKDVCLRCRHCRNRDVNIIVTISYDDVEILLYTVDIADIVDITM